MPILQYRRRSRRASEPFVENEAWNFQYKSSKFETAIMGVGLAD